MRTIWLATFHLRGIAGVLEQKFRAMHPGPEYEKIEWREVPDVLPRRDELPPASSRYRGASWPATRGAAADPDFREVDEPAAGAFYEFAITSATPINPTRLRSVSPVQIEARPGVWHEVIYDRKPELPHDDPAAGATLAAVTKERDELRAALPNFESHVAELTREFDEALADARRERDELREKLRHAHELDDRNQADAARLRAALHSDLDRVAADLAKTRQRGVEWERRCIKAERRRNDATNTLARIRKFCDEVPK